MWERIRTHSTFANVAAGLSLFLVLSTGTAVALSGTNTVFSDDIVNGQVGSLDLLNGGVHHADLGANSVTGGNVTNGSIGRADLHAEAWHTIAANPFTASNPCTANGHPAQTGIFCGYTKTPTVDEVSYWTNLGSGWQGARYKRDVTGEVHVQGVVKWVESNGPQDFGPAIFFLPVGFRPANGLMFEAVCQNPTGDSFGHGRIDVGSDGSVRWAVAAECSASGPGGYLSLSGISFPADA